MPPDEVARADAWLRTRAVLAVPSPGPVPAGRRDGVRADLARQLEALGPAPDDRTSAAARARRPSPADVVAADGTASTALRTTATALARDALTAEDPALARVLGAAAVSRATAARQLDGPGPPAPDGGALCDAAAAPAPGTPSAPGAVLWSALDRAGYAFEALAARTGASAGGSVPDGLPARGREDVEDLLELPAAREVLAADPGLPAGAYVLPGDLRAHPARVAETAVRDVQEAAAHVLARGDAGTRCWALVALERATGLQAELTGDVEALPGVLRDPGPQ